MEWTDEGVLLSVRLHGETAAIIDVLSEHHGRHAGVVPGGAGRRMSPVLQPGAQLALTWRARLEEHLGSFRVEPILSRSSRVMSEPDRLAGIGSMAALLVWVLPEREPQPAIYGTTIALMDHIVSGRDWVADYLRWELDLLRELGFGIDLSRCAVTGTTEELVYVSPRSGRAVSRTGAGDWAPKLLPLPAFLSGSGEAGAAGIADGFRLTGHFLQAWLGASLERHDLPPARQRLAERLSAPGRV